MGGQRYPLSDITSGRAAALKRSMACEEIDFEIPVVDPAELSVAGEKKRIPFSVSQMVALGEMRGTNEQWRKLVQNLSDREGTVIDISEDILAYEDQASLTEARQGPVEIEAGHVFAALKGNADWPTFIRVECWLRDCMMMEQTARHRAAALRLWSVSLGMVASPEAVRGVVEATIEWATYDVKEAQCSGRGSDMVAHVAWKRAMLYNEWLWTAVMAAADRASYEVLWDWRKVDKSCYTHPRAECPGGVGGKRGMDEMPHQDMLVGGYSGNLSTAADVVDGVGKGVSVGRCRVVSDPDEGEDEEYQLVDFSAQ